MVEIACPDDCRYLEAAQRHPAAVIRKQIDRDVTILMSTLGRVSEQQLQLFFLLQSVVLAHKPEGLARMNDADVALATGALAASIETASRGVIFEEATASVVAEGLRRALKSVIEEVTKNGGSRAEREVAVVLRGIERGAKHEGLAPPEAGQSSAAAGQGNAAESSYLELVARVFQQSPLRPRREGDPGPDPSKPLIVMP